MTSLPKDLTAESLFAWQDQTEAELERVLTDFTARALSAIVEQAMGHDLTAASSRHLWEEAVNQTLAHLGMGDDGLLREELTAANIGDHAYEVVQEVLSLNGGQQEAVSQDEIRAALYEALEVPPSLVASGADPTLEDLDDEELAAQVEAFWGDQNWVETTGTGHLPKYIRAIADALMRRGFKESHAIATAVNTVKRWARGGKAAKGAKHGKGAGHVSKKTQAKAIAALVEWEAKRAEAHAEHHSDKMLTMEDKTLEHHTSLSLTAAGGLLSRLTKPFSKWKTKIKRHVRTGFTGVLGRLVLAEMRSRGHRSKTWVAKHDSRTRETHRTADGQTVPIDEPFRVGLAYLQYPGERSGPIEEIANCRCVLVPGDS